MNIHFINLVGTQYFETASIVSSFFDAGFGLAIYHVKSNIDGRVNFMMNFGTGVEFRLSDAIGFKLKGGAKLPLFDSGTGLYCGIGNSSGVDCGLSFSSSVLVTY